MAAEVTRLGVLDMQVCVPSDWTDEQVVKFANKQNLCGTQYGWKIRRAWDKALGGDPERIECTSRSGCVHVMLDA